MALQKLGKYEILSEIGRGAMGVVYKAFDPLLEREVALKTMMASMGGMDGESKARFYREARSAAKLTHRNIVTIYDMGEEQGIPFIAMEFLDGIDLHRKMKREGPLPLRESLGIVAQVLAGLHYAHQFQIVHRDIKPANIYILKNGTAKILDFGIAKLASSEMTRTGMVLGTVDYMSPEQIRAEKTVDGRSDLFSAGVILYELISGKKPFPGETITQIMFRIVHDPPAEVPQDRALPPFLIEVLRRALEKEPGKRYSSGEEFAQTLEGVVRQIDAELTTVRQAVPEQDSKSRISTARRLFDSGSFEESEAILRDVLAKEPSNADAAQLLTAVGRRTGTMQTMAIEPETPTPSGQRGGSIEDILAEIEEERKTSPGAAGRSEAGAKDLTLRMEDSGVREKAETPAAGATAELTPEEVAALSTGKGTAPPRAPAAAPPPPPTVPPRTAEPPAAAAPPMVTPAPPPPKPEVAAKPAARPTPPTPPKPAPPRAEAPPVSEPARPAAAQKTAARPPAAKAPSVRAPAERPERIMFEEPAPEAPAKKKTVPVVIAVAAVLAVVIGAGLYFLLGRGGGSTTRPAATSSTSPAAPSPAKAPQTPVAAPPAPAPAAVTPGWLAIDAQPWAEVVSIREVSSGRSVALPAEAGRPAPTTPVVIDVPPGRYEVVLRHPAYQELTVRDLAVSPGQATRVNPTMPGFSFRNRLPAAAR